MKVTGMPTVYLNEQDVIDAVCEWTRNNVPEVTDTDMVVTVKISSRGIYSAVVETERKRK